MKSFNVAAGGLVERQTDEHTHIAVVHRKRYEDRDGQPGDWVLPKGKLEAGESLEQAAIREVAEETGCRVRVTGPSFKCEYLVSGVPKVVSFFPMSCTGEGAPLDSSEVAEVMWITPAEALERLTYETEREVVRKAYAGASSLPL